MWPELNQFRSLTMACALVGQIAAEQQSSHTITGAERRTPEEDWLREALQMCKLLEITPFAAQHSEMFVVSLAHSA